MVRQKNASFPSSTFLKAGNCNPKIMELAIKRGNLDPGKKGLGIERKKTYFKARVVLTKGSKLITFTVAI